jgi:hypothetical protein
LLLCFLLFFSLFSFSFLFLSLFYYILGGFPVFV